MNWLKNLFLGSVNSDQLKRASTGTPLHLALLRNTLEDTVKLIAGGDGWEKYRDAQHRSMGNNIPQPHERSWYSLVESGSKIDISGGVFNNFVIDISLKNVRARSTSFCNCIFLKAHFAGADLDDARFTNSLFHDGLYIQDASVRRADFTDAYFREPVYCERTIGLNQAAFSGLRLADSSVWTSFLAKLTDIQKASIQYISPFNILSRDILSRLLPLPKDERSVTIVGTKDALDSRVVRCTIPCAKDWKLSDVNATRTAEGNFIWNCPQCSRAYLEPS
jgi:hypothetical protein